MGILIIPLFLLDFIFVIFVSMHIFAMETLDSASWQNAMLTGAGLSLLFYLPMLLSTFSSGAQEALETGQTIINLMIVLVGIPAILVFVMSFFSASWYWLHVVEAVLGAISVCTFVLLILSFILPALKRNN